MLTKEQLLDRLVFVIKENYTHKFYKNNVDYARYCKQIMTGNDQGEILISFKKSESKDQKQQRISVYNSRTAYLANKIVSTFEEAERVDDNVEKIWSTSTSIDTFLKRLDMYEKSGFNSYVHDAVRRLNFFDPNAVIINEFYYKDPLDKPYVYPLECYSDQIIDIDKKHNEISYVIIRLPIKVKRITATTTILEDGWKYTIYGIGYAITFTQYGNESTDLPIQTINQITYTVQEFNTGYKQCPVVEVGYIKDPETNWETYVSPLHPAKHIFMDIMFTKSEYDLHKALHGFLQKFIYADKCTHVETIGDYEDRCSAGKMMISNKTCNACKGTGKQIHTTVQDVIYVNIPETREEWIPLQDFVHYVEIPKHIIDGWKEDLDKLEVDVSLAIFNKDTFTKSEVANTATEVSLNRQSVYNVLYNFAKNVSIVFKKLATLCADALGETDIQIDDTVTKDYKLQSVDELILQLKQVKEAGGNYEIERSILMEIMSKKNLNNKNIVDLFDSFEDFRPFKSKSKEEIIFIISTLPDEDHDKVLYIYFEKIISEIQNTVPNFAKTSYQGRKAIIKTMVDKIISEKKALNPPQIDED